MIAIVKALLAVIPSLFQSRSALHIEILVLRHQLNVLSRRSPCRTHLTNSDRLFFVWLYRLWPGLLRAVTILRPETIVRWHRQGFRAYWRWRCGSRPGRPKITEELRDLIREISVVNPLWGAPRIHGELLKLGIEVAQSTVSKYMVRGRGPRGQTWGTFLRNHADTIASIDLFVVPTMAFKLLFGFVVVWHGRRRVVSVAVTAHPTAEWLARQVLEAFPRDTAPAYLIRDRDRSYSDVFKRRVRSMGIRDRPISAGCPWRNPYVERLIGSIRRECLDHLVVFNEEHLRRLLAAYARYYNGARMHLSLKKDTPAGRPVQRVGTIASVPHLGGLHHSFVRI
jgi:transposase InsO family protein